MTLIERLGLAALHRMDPERAHDLSLKALRMGLVPVPAHKARPRLATHIGKLELPNPLGLAAGYDKNAVALHPLSRQGFGFIEVGAATPRPQEGNPKPRLYRLTEDRAAINRFGFNNQGVDAISARLAARPKGGIIGLNLGANKDSADRAGDFAMVLSDCGDMVDFATVNVSSPNTERLRDLQGAAALSALLARVTEARDALAIPIPVLLKIAPDLNRDEIAEIAGVARASGIDGIIATNTTLARDGLKSPHAGQTGGLSGQPLFEKSTRVLALLCQELDGALPVIGVGGISTAEQAFAKLRVGASALQLYTALIYGGLSLVGEILDGLEALLEQKGYANLDAAIGTGRGEWL